MFRVLSRVLGYLLLAGAFVAAVVDGTRSIAASGLLWTKLGDPLERMAPKALPALQGALSGLHPLLWDPLAVRLLGAPLALVLLVLGVLFVLLAADREPTIGYVARR